MKTAIKTKLKTNGGDAVVEVLLIAAVIIIVGALIYNANRPAYVASEGGVGYGYGLTALANVPNYNPYPYPAGYVAPVNTYNVPASPVQVVAPATTATYVTTTPRTYTTETTSTTVPASSGAAYNTTYIPSTPVLPAYSYGYTQPSYSSYNSTAYTYPYNYNYNYSNGYNSNTYPYNYNNGYNYNNTSTSGPTISLYGDNPYTVYHPGTVPTCYNYTNCNNYSTGSTYSEPGYYAYDPIDGNITNRVIVTNNRQNVGYTGTACQNYTINYSVTDSRGLTTNTTRTVNECYGL